MFVMRVPRHSAKLKPKFGCFYLLQALLQSSHMYAEAKHSFAKHGVLVDNVSVDVAAMQKQKSSAVEGLTKGIEGLFKKNKVKLCSIFLCAHVVRRVANTGSCADTTRQASN